MTNPFFTEFTAPDGSKRRPIVDRVPGLLKDLGISDFDVEATIESDEHGTVFWRDESGDAIGSLAAQKAAIAICRVAVEDWLTTGTGSHMELFPRPSYAGQWYVKVRPCPLPSVKKHTLRDFGVEWDDDTKTFTAYAESRELALNSAAHAVADAIGMEP